MIEKILSSPLVQSGAPLASYRFLAVFFGGKGGLIPNPIDIRFQQVSGISADFSPKMSSRADSKAKVLKKGKKINVPEEPEFSNLTLKRGFIPGPSPLRKEAELAIMDFEEFGLHPKNIIVILLGEGGVPRAAWLFLNANLMNYALSDLDASTGNLLIESLEFSYDHWQPLSL